MLTDVIYRVKYMYREHYGHLLFFSLLTATFFIVMPVLAGTILSAIFTLCFGFVLTYGVGYLERCWRAAQLNRDKSQWEINPDGL